MEEVSSVSVSQLLLVVAAIFLGAVVLKVLWVDHASAKPSTTLESTPRTNDSESKTPAEQARAAPDAAPAPAEGKALPVRVLYASSLGTAKGRCAVSAQQTVALVADVAFHGQGTVCRRNAEVSQLCATSMS